jgi:hypothetical protein
VVPDLGRVVEEASGLGGEDDLLERLALVLGALDETVEVRDVRLVVLAVVEVERLLAHVRRQGVLGVRQRRKLESHRLSFGSWANRPETYPPGATPDTRSPSPPA